MRPFTDETAPHQIGVEAYGTQLRVCASSPELLERAEALLPPGSRRVAPALTQLPIGIVDEGDGITYCVYRGSTCVSELLRLEHSLVVLDGQIRGFVAYHARERIFVHAGAVAHEGRAIIFPGLSFSGKTALTAAMVRAGATYLSDEYAVLDPDGLVHPYPKTLSVRGDVDRRQVEHAIEDLGGTAADTAMPLGLVVVTTYRPGAEWQPRQLSPSEAALALLGHTVVARSRPAEAMATIRRALEGVVTLQGERGEADDIAGMVLRAAAVA
jgi:hypothetical protein